MNSSTTTSTLPLHSQVPGSFTCISCSVRFHVAELQRLHMKTEWHRYNLKRRVAGLTPVSAAVFSAKVAGKTESEFVINGGGNNQYVEDEFGFAVHQKTKKFSSERQMTKKDLKRQAKEQERGRRLTEVIESQSRVDRSPSAATVISRVSAFSDITDSSYATVSSNDNSDIVSISSRGTDIHIPQDHISELEVTSDEDTDQEEEEDDDDESLIELPVTTCFYCGTDNVDIETNEKHMFERHGLYIPERQYVSDLEGLLDFIGHTVSIDNECLKCGFQGKGLLSIRQHLADKGHCVIPYETKEERQFWSQFYDFQVDEEEANGDENEEEQTSDNEEYITTVQIHNTGVEMALPNGAKLGHRSMQRYYRQIPRAERQRGDGERTVSLLYPQHKEVVAITKAEVKQKKELSLAHTKKTNKEIRQHLKHGNFQPHFRDVNLQ